MAEEWRVAVELGDEGHGLSLGERLRSLDLDDEVSERLGGRVLVTRDGSRMFLYAGSEGAAREAERVVREEIAAEGLDATTEVERWDAGDHRWEDISGAAAGPEGEAHGFIHPVFVFLGAHKPQILRDLGL